MNYSSILSLIPIAVIMGISIGYLIKQTNKLEKNYWNKVLLNGKS